MSRSPMRHLPNAHARDFLAAIEYRGVKKFSFPPDDWQSATTRLLDSVRLGMSLQNRGMSTVQVWSLR